MPAGGTVALLRQCVMENYSSTMAAIHSSISMSLTPAELSTAVKDKAISSLSIPPTVFVLNVDRDLYLPRTLGQTEQEPRVSPPG